MKELEVTLRVRNNRLKQRRTELGMTQPELAVAAEVGVTEYRELEQLRRSPHQSNGEWRKPALQLAKFHCVPVEDLFPASIRSVKEHTVVRLVDGAEVFPLLSNHQERLLESPDSKLEKAELLRAINENLSHLNEREREVIRLRFGLDGREETTLDEIAKKFGLSRERIRQIERRALRILRHPANAGRL